MSEMAGAPAPVLGGSMHEGEEEAGVGGGKERSETS